MTSKAKFIIAFAALFIFLCICNFFLFLGQMPIAIWDEARHGVSAYEMLKSGDWLITTYNGLPDYWNSKPPLGIWAVVAGFKVFGVSLFGLRIMSVLFSLITVSMIVIFAGRRISWPVGVLSGAVLVILFRFVAVHNVRSGDADALFIMLSTGAVFSAFAASRKDFWMYAAAFLLSLAFLTKSFHVGAPALTVLVILFWERGRALLSFKKWGLFVLCGLVPVVLWAMARFSYDGTVFFEHMLANDLGRGVKLVEEHGAAAGWYLRGLEAEFRGTYILALGLFFAVLYFARREGSSLKKLYPDLPVKTLLQVALCAAIPILIFSSSVSKVRWYIYPVYPFLVILSAAFIWSTLQALASFFPEHRRLKTVCSILIIFFLCVESVFLFRLVDRVRNSRRHSRPVQELLRNAGEEYRSVPIYTEMPEWEQDHVFAAKLYGDFEPREGGRQAWEQALPGALLLTNQRTIEVRN